MRISDEPIALTCEPHPSLWLGAFVARFDASLEATPSPTWLRAGLQLDAAQLDATPELAGRPQPAPDDALRKAVRDLLRHGGFKPAGRSKPACEFLLRAATRGELGSINLAVDLCNVASLHAGVPISVVDLERVEAPLRVGVVEQGRYVFNASGQEISLDGLLCLHDAAGPCANAVKDSQRSKTHAQTRETLCLLWGTQAFAARCEQALAWYRALHRHAGASLGEVAISIPDSSRS
ncbi:hypothetical protein G6O69_19720 [Pseudenhygromyxa sp. WMMC2535]|uniref:phenylalanine--tRNA ligase beta subunit-related protein n=1 Tax=Pseudenhygromyxa sp. WMMC2535 TaxID=2712867 RepID=UPI001554E6B8|nr:phenylalanine--tRNA ligase beta subunit-related protein [Pseudenhygromyxa sp. WMMC2535]NVB40084.1 hypothetical protein [Pseudenhygromyxa sp. WMMC2535]